MSDGKVQSAMRQWRAMQREQPNLSDEDGRVDNPFAVAAGFPAEVSVRPLRLHTPEVEYGGLGGHVYSRQFAQYLARVQPLLCATADKQARYWWASEYGRQRVMRRFIAWLGDTKGQQAFYVALTIASEFWGADAYERIMSETGHSAGWIARMTQRALTFAR